VQLWELPDAPLDMVVGFSNQAAGATVAAHFAAQGYRRPVVLANAASGDTRSAARVAGFVKEAERLGLSLPNVVTVDVPVGVRSADATLEHILAMRPQVDAAFAVGDQIAVALALACQRRAVAIPKDLAIAGFGDVGIAEALVPPLTTIRIDRLRLGELAGELLLARLRGELVSKPVIDVGFELIVRGST
jgi:LacI family transcriptional regulator, gluconate utilization system Gnt-I transcriptional repressor